MPKQAPAAEVFEREFLGLRGKLLELAAGLDRIARAPGELRDPRWEQLCGGLKLLLNAPPTQRTEAIQMLFSLPYDPHWRKSP